MLSTEAVDSIPAPQVERAPVGRPAAPAVVRSRKRKAASQSSVESPREKKPKFEWTLELAVEKTRAIAKAHNTGTFMPTARQFKQNKQTYLQVRVFSDGFGVGREKFENLCGLTFSKKHFRQFKFAAK